MLSLLKSSSIEKRNTNIELLRIVAMFLVLCVHADFLSLGTPKLNDLLTNPVEVFFKSFIESVSIVCVNVFVMISGWFGIRASIKGLCSFIFQCIYFSVGLYLLSVYFDHTFSITRLASSFLMTSYWFVPAYMGLYILSPALNALFDRYDNKQIIIILILFYAFQTIFGCTGLAKFIDYGYSCFSFIGLYITAKLIHKLTDEHSNILNGIKRKILFISIYLLSSLLLTVLFYLTTIYSIEWKVYAYVNPIVIVSSISLLLFFSSMRIKNSLIINYLASSIFAVYLIHLNKNFGLQYFKEIIQFLYKNFNWITSSLYILIFLSLIIIVAFILDQPRRICWNYLSKNLSNINWFKIKIAP